MISNHGSAKLVSDTLQRFRAELRQIHPSVEQSCSPEEFHVYSKALSRILHHLDTDILQNIYQSHPDLRPKDHPILGEKPGQ